MYKRSFKDYFGRNRKNLYMILGILLVSVFSLTIVYAALSVTLNIVGNAEVVASSWDIHLDNVKVTSGSVAGNAPTISGGTTATFSTNLTTPGDFYEFTIDVVNDGSIDAMIDSISKNPSLTTAQAKYLKYEITYQNGDSINTKQLVKKNDYVRLKVRVEYRKDITAADLPTTSETLNLSFTVNYVQSDGSGSVVTNNGAEKKLINVVKGDGTQTSDEVCIGDECFYVMYSDDTSVTMLAKYNLYVGNECSSDSSLSCTAYGDEATGMQDSTMLGYVAGELYKGTTAFSNTNSTYAGSLIEGYVNNYHDYLITKGVTPIEARLISKDELISLGCSRGSCTGAPSWVYTTSYWSGSTDITDSIFYVKSDGKLNTFAHNYDFYLGVRPVIVIDRGLIDGNGSSATKTLIEFTIGGTTYQAEEGMTWAEWAESEYNRSTTNTTILNIFNSRVYKGDRQDYKLHKENDFSYYYLATDVIDPTIMYSFDIDVVGGGGI